MRCGAHWRDARMLNLSSRGVGLSAGAPPEPGTYVEIRRGAHVIVARVMWTAGLRFGVRTQDPVQVEALIREPDASDAPAPAPAPSGQPLERRRAARSISRQHERSRALARMLESMFLGFLAIAAALLVFDLVKQSFQRPLAATERALAG
jgi:hypothetical protein